MLSGMVHADIENAFRSADLEDRKLVMKRYVVELLVDPDTQAVEGTLIDPLDHTNHEGEPDDSNSPICRLMVAPKGFEPSISWLRTMHP